MSSTSTKILIAALAIVATSLTAQAADLKVMKAKAPIYKAPPMPVAVINDWSGFYIGAHVGYGWADSVSTGVSGAPFGVAAGASVGVSPDGWLGGIQFGNNWVMQQYLLGFEMDFGYLGIGGTSTVAGLRSASVDYSWYSVIAGRLGMTFDNMLLYAKGGLALARIENTAGGVGLPTDFTSTTGWRTGYAVGGGLEYALTRQWSMKAEYLYMDFGDTRSTNFDGDAFNHSNVIHTAKLGLNYRFGATGGLPVIAKY